MEWTAVVPVKSLPDAKSRLLPDADPTRPELALAFLQDVLSALAGAAGIARVVVVTDDERVQRSVEASSASWLPEAPHIGLNPAAAFGAASLPHDTAVAIIAGDLPCLIPSAVDLVLTLAVAHDRAFVSDAQGIGTTMLLDRTAATCSPAFGERSRARHVQLGYVDLGLDSNAQTRLLLARARRDVDTQVDLWDARRMGVGAATQAVLLNSPRPMIPATARSTTPAGDVIVVNDDGFSLTVPRSVVDASVFRLLRVGQRLAVTMDDRIPVRIDLP